MDFTVRLIKAGEYLNGNLVASDDFFYIVSGSSGTVKEFRANLTAAQEQIIVDVAKELQSSLVLADYEEYLNTAFEYPLGSGNTYSMKHEYMSEFNALAIHPTGFTYPFPYGGNNGASIVFLTPVELNAFNSAALIKYETERKTMYIPKIAAIQAVTLNPPTTTMEDAITQIQAIVF